MEKRLKNILQKHNAEICKCGNRIGFGDIAWNEGCTEYGTPTSFIQIQCVVCQHELAWISSWSTVGIDDPIEEVRLNALLDVLEKDWK